MIRVVNLGRRSPPVIFLTVGDESIVAKWDHGDCDFEEAIKEFDDLSALLGRVARRHKVDLDQVRVMCSSTLDDPESFTDDPKIIRLAKEIRS